MRRSFLSALLVFLVFAIIPTAQMRVVPLDEEQGHVALGLALRHLGNVGIFMWNSSTLAEPNTPPCSTRTT